MKIINRLRPKPVVIPNDLYDELSNSEVLNIFQRRPTAVQKRHIRWIERADTDAERRERVQRVAGMMSRVGQYENSRRTSWVGPTRTT